MHIVVFGARGWIAGQLLPLLRAGGHVVVQAPQEVRADDEVAVQAFLEEQVMGTYARNVRVVSLLGRTHGEGCGTIDYLERPGKLRENVRDNLYAPLTLALVCHKLGVHFTYMSTGCVFNDDGGVEGVERRRYTPEDQPDFFGSSYSTVKGFTDRSMALLIKTLGADVLNVRIRMPITADLAPRNFITKITKYAKVCSVANSMTVLPTLLPVMADLMLKGHVGTVNLVNPGVIAHNEILDMYKELVDPAFTYANFTIEEQNAVLASRRSNNHLDTTFIERKYPQVPHIRDAVRECLLGIASSKSS